MREYVTQLDTFVTFIIYIFQQVSRQYFNKL
jgi:hypothetical protein